MDSERRRPSTSRTRRCLRTPRRCHVVPAPRRGRRAGVDRRPHRNGQGRTGRGPFRGGRPCQLAGADWRAGDADDEREGPTAFPGAASRSVRARHRVSGIHATYHEEDIRIGAGATIERTAVLNVGGRRGIGRRSRERARASKRETPDSGPASAPRISRRSRRDGRACSTSSGPLPASRPPRRRAAPRPRVSAFGSGTNENQFLIDGTNFTCPCNGIARAEPGIDFIQEVQVQSVGASAEFGNVQGAVINVVTRQGSERFLYDASYYGQTAGLTSQPVRLPFRLRPTGKAATSAPGTATSRRTSAVLRFAIGCGSSRDTSICATTTVSRAPIRSSRGPTSRTRSSRSSRGSWLRAGSWCRAFTTSSGSTPNNRRS